jgi:hypothetical protein
MSEHVFPEPYLRTETSDRLLADMLQLLNREGLTAHQANAVLTRARVLIDAGARLGERAWPASSPWLPGIGT